MKMKYVFFGGPDIAARALRACVDAFGCPSAVITTVPKRRGRLLKVTRSETHQAATEICPNTPVHTPEKITKSEVETLSKYGSDILIVVAYPRILGPKTRGTARLGAVNFHPSLLPLYRGPDPIRGPLFDNVSETGVTAMVLDNGMDTGPIIDQMRIPVDSNEDYGLLYEKICSEGIPFFIDATRAYVNGQQPVPQKGAASYTSKIDTEIEYPDSNVKTTTELFGIIRALSPIPGAKFEVRNTVLKIKKAHMIHCEEVIAPGVHILNEALHIVGSDAGTARIKVDVVLPAGKREMFVSDWIKGLR